MAYLATGCDSGTKIITINRAAYVPSGSILTVERKCVTSIGGDLVSPLVKRPSQGQLWPRGIPKSWNGSTINPLIVLDTSVSWAGLSAANTIKILDIPSPIEYFGVKDIQLIAQNPSWKTDVVINVGNIRTIGGSQTLCSLGSYSVPSAAVTVLDTCDAAWSEQSITYVTSSADTGDKMLGTGSAKSVIASGFSTGTICSKAITSSNISSFNSLIFYIKSSTTTAPGQLQIALSSAPNLASPTEMINLPGLTAGVWTQITVKLNNRTGDVGIVSVGLVRTVNLGAQTIWVDDLKAGAITTREIPIYNMFVDNVPAQIEIYNTTALGALDGFTAYIQLVGA